MKKFKAKQQDKKRRMEKGEEGKVGGKTVFKKNKQRQPKPTTRRATQIRENKNQRKKRAENGKQTKSQQTKETNDKLDKINTINP